MAMNPLQSLYYVSPACAFFLAFPLIYVEYPAMMNDATLVFDWGMLTLNATCAFALNLAVFLLIGKTSALTMNIAGVIKDWMLIFASQHFFGNPVTFLNYAGYVVAFLSVFMYSTFFATRSTRPRRRTHAPTTVSSFPRARTRD